MQPNPNEIPVAGHPDSPYPVATDSRPDRPSQGEGLLEVSLRTGADYEGEGRSRNAGPGPGDVLRYAVPGVPLLVIGSRPVASGSGTVWVRLPPGTHRVSVQAGGFAGWWSAEVEAGGVTVLEAYPKRAWSRIAEPPLVPDRFAETVRYWTIVFYLPVALAGALLLAMLPACLIGVFAPDLIDTDEKRTIAYGVFAAVVAALWAVMAVHHIGTMWSTKRHRRFQERSAAEPVGGVLHAYPLPMHAERIETAATGSTGVLLDLTWEVVWQRIAMDTPIDWLTMQYSGEPGPIAYRPCMPPPVVHIAGVETPLDWGRWWVPLPAGEHEIEVTVPRIVGGQAQDDERTTDWRDTVAITEGWYTHVRLDGRTVQYTERDRAWLRVTGFVPEIREHMTEGRLPDFRQRRLETEMLDGQDNPRMRHSLIDPTAWTQP